MPTLHVKPCICAALFRRCRCQRPYRIRKVSGSDRPWQIQRLVRDRYEPVLLCSTYEAAIRRFHAPRKVIRW